MNPNEIVLKELNRKDRLHYALYNKTRVRRPVSKTVQPVLAYEIYSIPSNPSEHETISILNQLVKEGKAHLFKSGDWIWYIKR